MTVNCSWHPHTFSSFQFIFAEVQLCAGFTVFRCGVASVSILLGYDVAWRGNWFQKFRYNIVVSRSSIETPKSPLKYLSPWGWDYYNASKRRELTRLRIPEERMFRAFSFVRYCTGNWQQDVFICLFIKIAYLSLSGRNTVVRLLSGSFAYNPGKYEYLNCNVFLFVQFTSTHSLRLVVSNRLCKVLTYNAI